MSKRYKLGMICGRFSHIHNGHKLLVDKALELCDNILILVGSAQESKTLRNPFDADFRIQLIKKVYNNPNIKIEKLNDLSNEYEITFEWGQYVIDNTKRMTGEFADLIITGNDDLRKGWFSEKQIENTDELVLDRKQLDISATKLRGYIIINDKKTWQKYVPQEIIEDFETIRNKLLQVPVYQEIQEKLGQDQTIENYTKIYKKYEEKDKEEKMSKK